MDQRPDDIRQAIEDTREGLADTIEALGQKADVKGRVSDKAKETGQQVATKTRAAVDQAHEAVPDQLAPAVSAVAGTLQEAGRRANDPKYRTPAVVGVVLVFVALLFVRRHRHRV
jgi:uncharacterized membrane protein YdfJ with MMPL/SSD domain